MSVSAQMLKWKQQRFALSWQSVAKIAVKSTDVEWNGSGNDNVDHKRTNGYIHQNSDRDGTETETETVPGAPPIDGDRIV